MNYEDFRDQQAERSRQRSASGREIGPLPPVADPKRRAACLASYPLFCKTYFPRTFYLDWSPDHRKATTKIQSAIESGGLFAFGMPRGSGKTSLCIAGSIWGVLSGRRKFVVNVGAKEDAGDPVVDQDIGWSC